MKIFYILFIFPLLGLNGIITVQSRLEANSSLLDQTVYSLDEAVMEFDCWSRLREDPLLRILECNVPCCYHNGYDAVDPSEPNGKCRYGQEGPEDAELLNDMEGIPDCTGGGGPEI
jgi:hypothetical protein